MKHIQITLASIAMILIINACVKSKDFIEDNADPTGKGYRPVSTNPLRNLNANPVTALDNAAYATGSVIKTELQFFSESPVDTIKFYTTVGALNVRTNVNDSNHAYSPAYSNIKRMDTFLITYTVPSLAKDTILKINFDIINKNGLNLLRTATIKGK